MSVQLLMEDFSCNTQSTECMHSKCVNCSDLESNMNDFHNNKESITFHQWIRVDNKIQKSEIESPCERHQSLEKTYLQHACYNKLKEELGQNEILLHVDYSENYGNIKYRALTLVTILFRFSQLVVISVKLVTNENITIISEASDHSRIAAFTCINKVFDFVREKHNLPLEVTLHTWSDECAG